MSSSTSVRSTTEPGVTARLPPTSNLLVSTVAGRRGGFDMSLTRRRGPPPRLAPPVFVRPGVIPLLGCSRMDPREVGGGEPCEDVARREPGSPFGPPVDVGVRDQPV